MAVKYGQKFLSRASLFDITRLCRLIPNSNPERRKFLSVPNSHADTFSCIPLFISLCIHIILKRNHNVGFVRSCPRVARVAPADLLRIDNIHGPRHIKTIFAYIQIAGKPVQQVILIGVITIQERSRTTVCHFGEE